MAATPDAGLYWSVMQADSTKMDALRRGRVEAIKQYVGCHYSDNGYDRAMIENLLHLIVTIYVRQLVPKSPAVRFEPIQGDSNYLTNHMGYALTARFKRMRMNETLSLIVMDAFFGMGIAFTGVEYEQRGTEKDGTPKVYANAFTDCIDLDDFVMDISAKRVDAVDYMAHDFWISRDVAAKAGILSEDDLDDIPTSSSLRAITGQGDRAEEVSRGTSPETKRIVDKIRLRHVYVPSSNKVFYLSHDKKDVILGEHEWTGPSHGPYRLLRLFDVPGQVLPLPPVANWVDANESLNVILRKMRERAENQKNLIVCASEEDAKLVRDAPDLTTAWAMNPQGIANINLGQLDNGVSAFMVMLQQRLPYLAGNINTMGGLSQSAGTATQEKMLEANASEMVTHLRDRVFKFMEDLCKDHAWWFFTDRDLYEPINYDFPVEMMRKKKMKVRTVFTYDDIKGQLADYDLKVIPFSLTFASPAERFNFIQNIITNMAMPMAPLLQQQGITVDLREFFNGIADNNDLPELRHILGTADVVSALAQQPSAERSHEAKPMATNTTRTYVRKGVSTKTPDGQAQVLRQALLGGNPQQNELG